MKVGKPMSKRTPVRLRNKIEKASAAKKRKDRKLAKKNPQWRSKLKKDPGIPNLLPFKDKLLHQIEETKRRREEDRVRKREEEKARRGDVSDGSDAAMALEEEDPDVLLDLEADEEENAAMGTGGKEGPTEQENPMAALLASARARASAYNRMNGNIQEDDDSDDDDDDEMEEDEDEANDAEEDEDAAVRMPLAPKDSSQKAHDKAFKSVISASDVLLYILDARDPAGTRSSTVENAITASPDKRLVLILNKIDLVPASVLKDWLIHLRRSFPTLPLRASASASNAHTFNHPSLTPQTTASNLIKSLKAYASSKHIKGTITVGIVGYPNVGKSSVVNALSSRLSGRKGGKECPVGAEAGITTALREVKLDNKIKLIDSPGIVFPHSSSSSAPHLSLDDRPANRKATTNNRSSSSSSVDEQARLILLNAIPPKDITDPVPAVTLLLERLSASEELFQKLLNTYDLPALLSMSNFQSGGVIKDRTTDFLLHVARKRGRLGKGGVPNLHAAAQTVVTDWRDGRIQGWTTAPKAEQQQQHHNHADKKEIVAEWAEEFKIDGLWGDEDDGGGKVEGNDYDDGEAVYT